MVEVCCGTLAAMNQATSGVCRVPSEASDSHNHSGNVEEVAALLIRKGKFSMRCHLKVMKVRRLAASGLKTPDGETCHSMVEKFVPLEFKEEL